MTDAHPLPRIEEILTRQGKFKVWTVLDMKDGNHQVPLRKEDRHITCMSTPRGRKQWTVLVMGLKNAGAIFQRMMEWILKGLDGVDVYIDDVIVGSTGSTLEECLANHERDLRTVMDRLQEHDMHVDPAKARLFMQEVEFCGHLMRDGQRRPAPGKLMAIQKWTCPQVVSHLRGFLGVTNYYSAYVPHYAELAAPLTSKLSVSREDGRKGSQKRLTWKEGEVRAFEELKAALLGELVLFQANPTSRSFCVVTRATGLLGRSWNRSGKAR